MLRAEKLLKYYGGKRALGPVSFEIGFGETVGILGLNGVGKTTLLRIVATDLRPSGGRIEVDGIDAIQDPHAVRTRIGFLPQNPPLYPDMTVGEYLRFAGRLRGMDDAALARRLPEVEEITHIAHMRDELVRHLSLGYRQRVGVAQAIIHDPALIIMDEPTKGLDPAQVVEMRNMIRDLKSRHTVLISSHNLPEISETCDRLMVLDAGQIVATGTEEDLSDRILGARRIEVVVRVPRAGAAGSGANGGAAPDSVDAVIACIQAVPGVREARAGDTEGDARAFIVNAEGDLRSEVCRALVLAGYDVIRLGETREKLETIFLQLVATDRARDLDAVQA